MSPGNQSGSKAYTAMQPTTSSAAMREYSCMFTDMDHHYRTLLGTLPAIVYTLDEKGHFTFLSDSVSELGYTRGDLLGKHFSCVVHEGDVHQVSRDDVLPRFSGIATGANRAPKLFDERRSFVRKTTDLGVRILSMKAQKDGPTPSIVRGKVHAAGQYGPQGHPYAGRFCGTVGVISDLVAEDGTPVMAEKNKFDSVDLLGRALVHGFSNVLTAIYGNVQLIELQLGAQSAAVAENIRAVKEGVDRAVSLVNRISSMSSGGPYNSECGCLHDIVRQAAAEAFAGTSLGIELSFEHGLLSTVAPSDDLDKIVRAMFHHLSQVADPHCNVVMSAKNATSQLPAELPDQTSPYVELRIEARVSDRGARKASSAAVGVPDKAVALALSYFYATKTGGLITAETRQDTLRLTAYLAAH